MSWQSIIAVDSFLVGGVVQALIVLNDANYTPERWQGTLLTFAAVIFIASFNIFFARNLPLAEGIFACIHVFAFVPVIVCLWYLTPEKQTAAAVFTQFTDNGAGWPSLGATVLVGQVGHFPLQCRTGCGADVMQVSSMFVVLGSDSVAHMAEEIEDAGVVVPKVSRSESLPAVRLWPRADMLTRRFSGYGLVLSLERSIHIPLAHHVSISQRHMHVLDVR